METELLAPAGEPEAGYAAFQYGADAIYLGLQQFSARAEAVNFSLDELNAIIAFAHAHEKPKRVFLTCNTLIQQKEMPGIIDLMASATEMGVDAVIVQDLGVARVVRTYFPRLRMHASTQMAIHSLEGAKKLRDLGFSRVTLARELTLDEVADITAHAGIETEVFIHGALCYSYSGLCLYSSHLRGRSGNRGRCAYPCRERCTAPQQQWQGMPFSMKDLALRELAPTLRDMGVSSLKIEGRKKSPLAVATAVSYYRGILDHAFTAQEITRREEDMRIVFSRPWTKLFSESQNAQTTVDTDTTGHRGIPIGTVDQVFKTKEGISWMRVTTSRRLERYDGLQIDIPRLDRPFGFSLEQVRINGELETGFFISEGTTFEVALPEDRPVIPIGAVVYHASSQSVKQRYRVQCPKPGAYRLRLPMEVTVHMEANRIGATAIIPHPTPDGEPVEVTVWHEGTFSEARNLEQVEDAARGAFEKLGDTFLSLTQLTCENPDHLFVPVSMWNALRREMVVEVEAAVNLAKAAYHAERIETVQNEITPMEMNAEASGLEHGSIAEAVPVGHPAPLWWLTVDNTASLAALDSHDWQAVHVLTVDISRQPLEELHHDLAAVCEHIPKKRVMLALPVIIRAWEVKKLRQDVASLLADGWRHWRVGSLAGMSILREEAAAFPSLTLELTADWTMSAMNAQACRSLLESGFSHFTFSPEDDAANIKKLLSLITPQGIVIAYQDTPLFISESCVTANMRGGCEGRCNCPPEILPMRTPHGEAIISIRERCRAVTISAQPFSLAGRMTTLAEMGARHLRADFIWRAYTPESLRETWHALRTNAPLPLSHSANFQRGLL